MQAPPRELAAAMAAALVQQAMAQVVAARHVAERAGCGCAGRRSGRRQRSGAHPRARGAGGGRADAPRSAGRGAAGAARGRLGRLACSRRRGSRRAAAVAAAAAGGRRADAERRCAACAAGCAGSAAAAAAAAAAVSGAGPLALECACAPHFSLKQMNQLVTSRPTPRRAPPQPLQRARCVRFRRPPPAATAQLMAPEVPADVAALAEARALAERLHQRVSRGAAARGRAAARRGSEALPPLTRAAPQPDPVEASQLQAWYMDDSDADARLPHQCALF